MKKNFLSIIAIVLALTFSAFTTSEKSTFKTVDFYLFIGQPGTSDETDPTKYVEDVDPGCSGGSTRCGVYANPGMGGHPDLSVGHTFVDKK